MGHPEPCYSVLAFKVRRPICAAAIFPGHPRFDSLKLSAPLAIFVSAVGLWFSLKTLRSQKR